MSKNTLNSAFRKIDVDQFNEDNFRDDDKEDREEHEPTLAIRGPDDTEIISLLNQGKHVDALKTVLQCAPLGSKNQQVKDSALTLTLKVMLTIKSGQIEEAVAALDRDLIDVLMKYIYKGFEFPSEGSSGHLLLWHEKAFQVGGHGSIIRVLTDTRRI